jgi:hypothetical protein
MPWRLQYFRHRRNARVFSTCWVAAPWGSLLSMVSVFLLVTVQFVVLGQFSVPVAVESDTSVRPLVVLRIRADRTATLTYFRADKLPDVRAAVVRKDFAVLPLPPLPADITEIGHEWFWGRGRAVPCPGGESYYATAGESGCWVLEAQRVLVAKNYHRSTDWDGIARGLRNAKTVGISSDVVWVEADDHTQLDAIIRAMDLCVTERLRPRLRMQ